MRIASILVAVATMIGGTTLATAQPATAASPGVMAAAAAIDPAVLGTTPDAAAGSCWEIKQQNPSAADGDYWLLTPAMNAPQQFYCDQTTDGGGWVLVGKGRNGWDKNNTGQGKASELLTPDTMAQQVKFDDPNTCVTDINWWAKNFVEVNKRFKEWLLT